MRSSLLVFLVAVAASASPQASEFDSRVAAEIPRLERSLATAKEAPLPKELAPMIEQSGTMLSDARSARDPLLRLYRLRDAYVAIESLDFLARHHDAAESTDRVRAMVDARRAEFETPLQPMRGAALQAALRQVAANRAEKLFHTAVPFARASGAFTGLYYLAEAEGNRRFAELVTALPFPSDANARPNLPAVESALARLDTAVLAIFEKDPGGKTAIAPGARLKEARELASRGYVEGAALTLLEAQLSIKAPAGTAGKPARDSVAALWIARKEGADDTTRGVIDRQVLPLYASLFTRPAGTKKVPSSVTVTLVRWPYT